MSHGTIMSRQAVHSKTIGLQRYPEGILHQKIPESVHANAARPVPVEDCHDTRHRETYREADTALPGREDTPLARSISQLSVPEKIALARRANKRERSILINDPSKEVAIEVIHNNKITDGEAEMIARMTHVDAEVISIIAENREWTRQTNIARALVNNPKTPVHIASRLVHRVHTRDLRTLSTNRNIATVIRHAAKELLAHRHHHGTARGRRH